MRTTGFRSFVLYLLLALFLGGLGYLFVNLCINGSKWVTQPYNGHIYAEDATADTGTITDKNNVILAETKNKKRVYSDNSNIRRSLLHTVGDSSGYIGTSVQAQLRSKLMGYNIFTGLNRTPLSKMGVNNLKLTVDASLCATAYEELGEKKGAVVVYNYNTGEVLCKVSTPNYDPMDVPENLSDDENYKGVFLDNTISSSYVPGSIFKMITAACSMENLSDWQDKTFNCTGSVNIGGGTVTCLDYHGDINMSQAFGHSCNVYFSLLSDKLGKEKIQKTAEEFGFNQKLNFQDFSCATSVVDLAKANSLELGWAGIGQYTITSNPMHMAVIMSAIANGGKSVAPRITSKAAFPSQSEISIPSSVASHLKTMLRNNVENYYGDYLFPDMNVCAKTGTAEVGNDKNPTAWIVGFSENAATPYAFAIAVEEGGSGIESAGAIASRLMQKATE